MLTQATRATSRSSRSGSAASATLAELREIPWSAEVDGATSRAVGSGHSWPDVALTTGYVVRTDRLGDPLEVEPSTSPSPVGVTTVAFVLATATLRRRTP
jgi:hypothetical protein